MDMICESKVDVYNKFTALSNGIEKISDYLIENSQDLFKLMKYIEPTDTPLAMPDLTNKEKAAMICSDAVEMYNANSTVKKNIIYQVDVDEAFWIEEPQIRMEIGNFFAVDSYRGVAEINILIVVPNSQRLFTNGANTLCDRSVAIALELIRILNGAIIPNSTFYSNLFINKTVPDGAGRSTGATRLKLNKGHSGYFLTFGVRL